MKDFVYFCCVKGLKKLDFGCVYFLVRERDNEINDGGNEVAVIGMILGEF